MYFIFDDIHFSSRRAGSDKLASVCNGGICIFIPLNKKGDEEASAEDSVV